MKKNIAFFVRHFLERGTERTTFDYADFNEKILLNKSLIICFTQEGKDFYNLPQDNNLVRRKFEERFRIYEISRISDIRDIISKYNIDHFYTQSHGFHRDIYQFSNKNIWLNCNTIYHCAFGPMVRQGSNIRCIIGGYLNRRYFKKLPVLPSIVRRHTEVGNLRDKYKIPSEAFVIGRHGGFTTFDINFVKESIANIVNSKKNLYFIFLNTEEFYTHERIMYMSNFKDKDVFKFINTCNCMLHAREDGETFGLSVAEFSAANKPIITYSKSKDKEHLSILGDKAIKYKNINELNLILNNIENLVNPNFDYNCYRMYEPEKVIKRFEKVCLVDSKASRINRFINFLLDIPWEIYIILISLLRKLKKEFVN